MKTLARREVRLAMPPTILVGARLPIVVDGERLELHVMEDRGDEMFLCQIWRVDQPNLDPMNTALSSDEIRRVVQEHQAAA